MQEPTPNRSTRVLAVVTDAAPLAATIYLVWALVLSFAYDAVTPIAPRGVDMNAAGATVLVPIALIAGLIAFLFRRRGPWRWFATLALLPVLAVLGVLVAIAALGSVVHVATIGVAMGVIAYAHWRSDTRRLAICIAVVVGAQLVVLGTRSSGLRGFHLPGLVLVLTWLALSWRHRDTMRPAPLFSAMVVLALGALPLTDCRVLSPTTWEIASILSQEDVEHVFENSDPAPVPARRMEFLCDPSTGVRILSPHFPSHTAAFLDPSGHVRGLHLEDEGPDRSIVIDGVWHLVVKGEVVAVDIATRQVLGRHRFGHDNSYGMHRSPESALAAFQEDEVRGCHVIDLHAPARHQLVPCEGEESVGFDTGYECLLLDDRTLLSSGAANQNFHRHIARRALSGGEILRETRIPDVGPFYQMTADPSSNTLYVPRFAFGDIQILDLDSLTLRGTAPAHLGVRGVLLPPHDPSRFYSWNYLTGQILEHHLPSGAITREWRVGPLARTLRWDCTDQVILASSMLGGFRIHLTDRSARLVRREDSNPATPP